MTSRARLVEVAAELARRVEIALDAGHRELLARVGGPLQVLRARPGRGEQQAAAKGGEVASHGGPRTQGRSRCIGPPQVRLCGAVTPGGVGQSAAAAR